MIARSGIALALLSASLTVLANPIDINQRDAASSTTVESDSTIVARTDASSYPYGNALDNEFQWRNWDPKDDEQKKDAEKIHNAFKEWQDFVKAGLGAASNKDGDTFKRWFGKQDDPNEIKNVFANMWDDKAGKATDKVAKMICDRDDFKKFCTANRAAYTVAATGEFHVCQRGLDRKLNSEIKCDDLDDSCSAKMRSLPMTLLHEMTHVDTIGTDARGGIQITDEASGAYDCFKLNDDEKGDNAQNYAWLAGEAYWSKECSKTFKDPAAGVKTTANDEPPENGSSNTEPVCNGGRGTVAFDQGEADAKIAQFCGDERWQKTVIVPPVSFGHGQTSDGRGKALGVEDSFDINGGKDKLWMDVSFAESSCIGNFQFDRGACETNLREALNGCDTGGLYPKYGGWTDDVCAVYRLKATAGTGGDSPFFIQGTDAEMTGDWACKDTDTSALGPDSPLEGTCTCWYSGMPSVTDVFDKVDGSCDNVKKDADPKTN